MMPGFKYNPSATPASVPFHGRKDQQMKTVKQLSLCACALAILMYSCGKDKGTTPVGGAQANTYEADTLATKAILDANSIPGISPTDAICFRKDQRPVGTGPYRVVDIRLPNKSISVIPAQIGQLTALENIWLDSNTITALPAEIGNCKALKFVDLSKNNLTTLPEQIGGCTALTTLNLSINSISSLPAGFWSMTALTTVHLDHNALAALSPQVSSLVKLQMLDIRNNQLTDLPSSITGLDSLQSVLVDNNKLCNVAQAVADFVSIRSREGDTTWKTTQACP